ncbi:MAG: Sensory box protein [Clostridia bacterium 41_269]|nr:MAG: Sensory box protein [Clostridia bacterium 41_269]
MGSSVVLDDFGTGFSSIKNLVLFPVSEIKIDSFLAKEMMIDKKAEILVSSIIFAAKEAGYLLTLEGVENEEQFLKAKQMGFNMVQGYYIAKPILEEEFIKKLLN